MQAALSSRTCCRGSSSFSLTTTTLRTDLLPHTKRPTSSLRLCLQFMVLLYLKIQKDNSDVIFILHESFSFLDWMFSSCSCSSMSVIWSELPSLGTTFFLNNSRPLEEAVETNVSMLHARIRVSYTHMTSGTGTSPSIPMTMKASPAFRWFVRDFW